MTSPHSQQTNCWGCRYFKITHEKNMPYACNAMGFKSKMLPCLEVTRIEGSRCLSFAPKPSQGKPS